MLRRLLPICVTLLAGCATTGSGAGPTGPDSVTLRFAPQPGTAQVESERVRRVRIDDVRQTRRTTLRFTRAVLAVPEGFAYATEDATLTSEGMDEGLREVTAQVAERMRVVVSNEGEIVAVHGLDDLQRSMLSWWDSLEHGEIAFQAQARRREAVLRASDPHDLMQNAAAEWYALAGAWEGRTLELGTPYPAEQPRADHLAARRLPCTPEEQEARCVLLVIDARPDEAQLARAQASMAELHGGHGSARDVEVVDRLELIAEPDTLTPYRLVKRRELRSTLLVEGRPAVPAELVDVRTTTWTYPETERP